MHPEISCLKYLLNLVTFIVYTLWKHPDMIHYFTTWPPVFSKLTAGAGLMILYFGFYDLRLMHLKKLRNY